MELPPQPSPDAPAPPPGPEAVRSRDWMKALIGLGLLSILVCFVWWNRPLVLRSARSPDLTEAISNLKQINLALMDFDAEFGRYPDVSTIAPVQAKTGTSLVLGSTSSNDFFRQLIASGTKSEKIFWAKTATTPRKPNDRFGSDTLVKGECGFTYIAGRTLSGFPRTPVAMAAVVPGTWRFDSGSLNGLAAVLYLDGSVMRYPIDAHGHVMINGMNLFDPRQPHWDGKPPDIKWPE